jgi:hypothetical protein
MATRATRGAIPLSSSSNFDPKLGSKTEKPVKLPPGRARLCTKPSATGLLPAVKMTGTLRVNCCTIVAAASALARITSGADRSKFVTADRIQPASPTPQWKSI